MMGVSRSGYYKWKNHTPTSKDLKREEMIAIVADVHEHHKTHGYRWTAAFIHINMQIHISESYTYKCFRFLGIQAQTCHKPHPRSRKEKDKYPNLIFSTWDTVDRPGQVIVSDMTALKLRYGTYYEITFYFDVFTKEILAWRVGQRRGARDQYIDGLKDVVDQLKGCTEPTIVHTDQGSVYASMAYNELISRGRTAQAAEYSHRGGFACAVCPEETEDFALAHVEGNVIDCSEVAEAFRQMAYAYAVVCHIT